MAEINPCKVSGKPGVLQTRQEEYDELVAKGVKELPTLVRDGDIAFIDPGDNEVRVKAKDVNTGDVRVVCAESGRATGWDRAANTEKVIAAWNADNAGSK